ncbi:MAG TPA: hypothetical protein VK638_24035, partial [Edaphobacter sp.]|nr:hypothetical protein [Edaphobacter sp.]
KVVLFIHRRRGGAMNFIESDIVWHNAYTSETQIWTMGGGFQIKARGSVEDENGRLQPTKRDSVLKWST